MRTVDPEVWSKRLKKPTVVTTRTMRFGQHLRGSLETCLRLSFVDAIKEFWSICSVAGVKYFNLDSAVRWQRNIQMVIFVILIVCGLTSVTRVVYLFLSRKLGVVTPMFSDNLISGLAFPAVALCSNRVISKAALQNYSRYLYSHPVNREYGYTLPELEAGLVSMGALLTLSLPNFPSLLALDVFQQFIMTVESQFNVSDIMLKLSPSCSSLLWRCSWRTRVVACEELFATRVTPLGYCCVFNSRYMWMDHDNTPQVLDQTGHDQGLGVVITENPTDIAYMRRLHSIGVEMLIFPGDEYPLPEAGSVRLQPVPLNTSVYYRLRTNKQTAHLSLLQYLKNNCELNGQQMSWCMIECRLETALALCGCVPYSWQSAWPHHTTCSLEDLPCLNKHREKFLYMFPEERDTDEGLEEELENSLSCFPPCEPQCHSERHQLITSYAAYEDKPDIFRNFLARNFTRTNSAVVRVYYSREHQPRFVMEIHTRWYEVLMQICSHWGALTGITAVSLAELVYCCTVRWSHHYRRRRDITRHALVATSQRTSRN